ncbi:MAG: hypothetical protein KatS3mg105_0441 [Gemmatales bacterium]|nr:MAG: hypothetical protein KatS3mg105_0441 [Gemmatales bacterium]
MRIACCLAGFIVFGLVLFAAFGEILIEENWVESFGPWAWLAATVLIISDIVVPVPTTVVITMMGQQYGPLVGGAIGTLATFLAGVTAYGLTRLLGMGFARFLLRDEWEAAHQFFQGRGGFAVACSRWLPLLPEAISCLAGLARMPLGRYCVSLLCGAVPMSYSYAALAALSDDKLIPLVISIVLPIPTWWLAVRLLYRRASPRAPA